MLKGKWQSKQIKQEVQGGRHKFLLPTFALSAISAVQGAEKLTIFCCILSRWAQKCSAKRASDFPLHTFERYSKKQIKHGRSQWAESERERARERVSAATCWRCHWGALSNASQLMRARARIQLPLSLSLSLSKPKPMWQPDNCIIHLLQAFVSFTHSKRAAWLCVCAP